MRHTHFAPQLDPSKPRLGRSSEAHDDVAKRIANSVAENVPPKPRALPESHSELKIVMVQFFAASLDGLLSSGFHFL